MSSDNKMLTPRNQNPEFYPNLTPNQIETPLAKKHLPLSTTNNSSTALVPVRR